MRLTFAVLDPWFYFWSCILYPPYHSGWWSNWIAWQPLNFLHVFHLLLFFWGAFGLEHTFTNSVFQNPSIPSHYWNITNSWKIFVLTHEDKLSVLWVSLVQSCHLVMKKGPEKCMVEQFCHRVNITEYIIEWYGASHSAWTPAALKRCKHKLCEAGANYQLPLFCSTENCSIQGLFTELHPQHSLKSLILRRGLAKSLNCPDWAWICYNSSALDSQGAGIIAVYHQT